MLRWTLALAAMSFTTPAFADAPAKLTPKELDALVAKEFPEVRTTGSASDEMFLRRIALDLVGRQPTMEELAAFAADASPEKRAKAIDRFLASKEFGQHWADYWSDTISYRVPPPELTFLDYKIFKTWLTDQFNANVSWDKITRELLTASGEVKKVPAATFIGYHQGRPAKLAAETARIFLGLQLQCAECHDHKFDVWKRQQFHSLAAFFARTSGKLGKAQDGSSTEVKDASKGEWTMSNVKDPRQKGQTMTPAFLTGQALPLTASDKERRTTLARLLTQTDNPWFAKAYVNRVWARLMGRGFYEPVDNLADYQKPVLVKVHQPLAEHFVAAGFDTKDFFRLVMNTEAYQRAVPIGTDLAKKDAGKTTHTKLNGDEVFRALVVALALPNVTPPAMKPTAAIRFPPPPKSTRDLVADKFGYDPSLCPEEISRTMAQAMLLMNNKQIQAQIDADPTKGTLLGKLLQAEKDDRGAVTRLIRQVLARQPTEQEVRIALEHIQTLGDRGRAYEDILWSLINSAEFTTRR